MEVRNGLIKQFLTDVTWGELDALIIDTPPGTSDELLASDRIWVRVGGWRCFQQTSQHGFQDPEMWKIYSRSTISTKKSSVTSPPKEEP